MKGEKMSHLKSSLALTLIIIVFIMSTSAVSSAYCVNCGIDGREVNDIGTKDLNLDQKDYYPSTIAGGRVIDFESYEDYQNINGQNLGGVTLSNPVSGIVEIFANNRCGAFYHSPTKVFYGNICDCATYPIIGIFEYPATYIGLWAGDNGDDIDSWKLEAFDAPIGGNSLGMVTSGDWNGYPYRKLEISAADIWRFEASWTGVGCGVAYDDLDIFVPLLSLEKIDDVNDGDCVNPGREIKYTIIYNPDIPRDNNFVIIDYLPLEVGYSSSSPEGDYNEIDRTVTWDIGTTLPDGNGMFILNCIVNNFAVPCSSFINRCELMKEGLIYNVAEVSTPVCAWDPGIIYVDANADGSNTGMSWQDAYLDLQDALDRASCGGGSEIWVAVGDYFPSVKDPCYPDYGPTFKLIDGVPVYGHFAGSETSREQRDFNDPNYETILSGAGLAVRNVVTASGLSQDNIIDCLTIRNASVYASAGVKIENACLKCLNCLISNNGNRGIYAVNSNFTVSGCVIQNNGAAITSSSSDLTAINCDIKNNNGGIQEFGASSGVIEGCRIFANLIHGIEFLNGSGALIRNNMIYRNAESGINLNSTGAKSIRNNTIFDNRYGINVNSGTAPVITNCIVWNNTDDLRYCSATYSCIKNNDSGLGNIHSDPRFVEADMNDFHLKPDSNCIDAGDPCFIDFNETDIDGECRILFGKTALRVDMGADEFYWPKADFDNDEIVNFIDFAIWAPAWHTIDSNFSLDDDEDIDIYDLAQFCNDWLWVAPWTDLYQTLLEQHDSAVMGTVAQSPVEPMAPINRASVEGPVESYEASEPVSYEELIPELVEWLDQKWQSGEIDWSEEDYLDFRKKIQELPE